MVYFRKYFGKCALTAHFAPQTTPQSPTNDLPTTRSPMLLPPLLQPFAYAPSRRAKSNQYWSPV